LGWFEFGFVYIRVFFLSTVGKKKTAEGVVIAANRAQCFIIKVLKNTKKNMDLARMTNIVHTLNSRISALENSHVFLSGKGKAKDRKPRDLDEDSPLVPRNRNPMHRPAQRIPREVNEKLPALLTSFYTLNQGARISEVSRNTPTGEVEHVNTGWKFDEKRNTAIFGTGFRDGQICLFNITIDPLQGLRLMIDNPMEERKRVIIGFGSMLKDYLDTYFIFH